MRAAGAVPATIAIMSGRIHIGLTEAELDSLGQAKGVAKLSRADLAAYSFDISADLKELAQTPVTVVAAGAKAILDLPKTLEVLETEGVPVIAYGQDDFPAFWSRASGLMAPLRMDSPAQIAAAHLMRESLGLPGGQLVANPIPVEAEISRAEITPVIETALAEAAAQGISAKAVTPFLLQRIFELTKGRSLAANIALVLNNARLAAAIARDIAAAQRG